MLNRVSRKQRVVEAAVALFADRGIAATTSREIAKAAGVAEGTIFRYFPTKDDLARDVFVAAFVPLCTALERIRAEGGTARAQLGHMVRHFYDAFDSNPALFTFVMNYQHGAHTKVPKGAPTPLRSLERVIAEGVAAGEFRAIEPRIAAEMALGAIIQPCAGVIYGELQGPLARHLATVEDSVWRLLAA